MQMNETGMLLSTEVDDFPANTPESKFAAFEFVQYWELFDVDWEVFNGTTRV